MSSKIHKIQRLIFFTRLKVFRYIGNSTGVLVGDWNQSAPQRVAHLGRPASREQVGDKGHGIRPVALCVHYLSSNSQVPLGTPEIFCTVS